MKALLLAPMGSIHRRFCKANIQALKELGYKVELCANFENGEGVESHNKKYAEDCERQNIKVHFIRFKRHSLWSCLFCIKALKQLLQEQNYDIVHAHTETGGLLLRLAGEISGKKYYTTHGMSFWKGSSIKSQMVYKPIERWICEGMDQNLGMNCEEFETLNSWCKDSANFVHGIGLDLKRIQTPVHSRVYVRKNFIVEEGKKLIVSVGELNDNKNHIAVIKA